MTSNSSSDSFIDPAVVIAVSYIPIILIVVGLTGNTISFLIFTFNSEMNKYSSTVYLSFIAVADTCALFVWNLDHFLKPNFGFTIETTGAIGCKLGMFVQYISLQTSGFLYSLISIDRYFTVISRPGSWASRLPFSTRKSAFIWSAAIVCAVCLINAQILFTLTVFPVDNSSSKLICLGEYYDIWILDDVNFALYTLIPILLMAVFNTLLIMNIMRTRASAATATCNSNRSAANRKIRLTISLIVITMAFVLMTAPSCIGVAFFAGSLYNHTKTAYAIATVLDCLMFTQQTILFVISFLTNKTFADSLKAWFKRNILRQQQTELTSSATSKAITQATHVTNAN